MKKLLALGLCATMVFTMAGCSSKDSADETTKVAGDATEAESEATRTTFVVGFDAEYPPYGYMDENGEYTGFDLELAQKVCDMEGWTLEKKPIAWDSKDLELDGGTIDCIWNGFTINGREDQYTWSDPYCDNSQVIVVSKASGIEKLADLDGKVVGVQAASAALDVLNDSQADLASTFSDLKEYADYNSAFLDLESNVIDAVAMDVGVANYQISQRGDDDFIVLEETLNSEQYGVGFKLGNTELRDIVNADLHKLAEDGTIASLAEKYDISNLICIE